MSPDGGTCVVFMYLAWAHLFDNLCTHSSLDMDMEGGFAFESTERLFVYRHNVGVAKTEGKWRGRARHVYDPYR